MFQPYHGHILLHVSSSLTSYGFRLIYSIFGNCFSKKKVRALYGKWIEGMFSHDVRAYEKWQQNSGKSSSQPTETSLQSHSDEVREPAYYNKYYYYYYISRQKSGIYWFLLRCATAVACVLTCMGDNSKMLS